MARTLPNRTLVPWPSAKPDTLVGELAPAAVVTLAVERSMARSALLPSPTSSVALPLANARAPGDVVKKALLPTPFTYEVE